MNLDDILRQLAAWFPPEAHKERKLPGGSKWFYLPHQAIRDRLNEICPSDWSDELKGPFLSGNETVMICRLTICGVTREGIADSKVFPELNDDGKEKIIGSPVVNAARHAFRDAAEQFGIGAYLDDQKKSRDSFVKYMRGKGDGRAYQAAYNNGWVQDEKGEPAKKARPRPKSENGDLLEALSGGSPQLKVVAPVSHPSLYPQQNAAIKKIREKTGHNPKAIADWCKHYECEAPSDLPPDLFVRLVENLAVGWAKSHFPTEENARASYQGKVQVLRASGVSVGDAAIAWIESVMAAPV
jgi:hypothetical protein